MKRKAVVKTRQYFVGRGLARREAYRRARQYDGARDLRGFKYDRTTGIAYCT